MSDGVLYGEQQLMFGLKPRRIAYGSLFAPFGDEIDLIPEPFWYSVSYRDYVPKVLNQGNQRSCTGAASVAGMMTAREQAGFEYVELSIGSVYGQINGGTDRGAYLSDALKAVHEVGACPISIIPHENWHMETWPKDWREKAAKFRVLEVYDCTTFEEIASAILRGFVVCFGVLLSREDIQVGGQNGFLPIHSAGRKYGHAMLGVGLKRYNKTWWVEALSSWGEKWGDKGFCYVPASMFNLPDAWAIRVVTYANGIDRSVNHRDCRREGAPSTENASCSM